VASSEGTNCPGSVEAHLGSLAGLLTLEAAADAPVREEWWMRALQFMVYGGPEVVEWGEAPDPHPGTGQIRV
jgi:hypothetical protein